MAEFISVKFDMSELEAVLNKYAVRDRNIDMVVAAEALRIAMNDVITSEGVKGEQGRWKGFKESTLRRHPRRIGGKLLQDSGFLANIQTRVKPRLAEAYSPAPYAKHHITGTRHMARRDPTAVRWGPLLDDIANSILMEVEV